MREGLLEEVAEVGQPEVQQNMTDEELEEYHVEEWQDYTLVGEIPGSEVIDLGMVDALLS